MNKRMTCQTCVNWGRTILDEEKIAIPCPDCKRKTWPNLGVNCPAGAAVALSSVGAIQSLENLLNVGKPFPYDNNENGRGSRFLTNKECEAIKLVLTLIKQ